MADVNQPGIVQKVNVLCNKYNSSAVILNEKNGKAFTSLVKQNMCKPLINHQLLKPRSQSFSIFNWVGQLKREKP